MTLYHISFFTGISSTPFSSFSSWVFSYIYEQLTASMWKKWNYFLFHFHNDYVNTTLLRHNIINSILSSGFPLLFVILLITFFFSVEIFQLILKFQSKDAKDVENLLFGLQSSLFLHSPLWNIYKCLGIITICCLYIQWIFLKGLWHIDWNRFVLKQYMKKIYQKEYQKILYVKLHD